MCRKIQYDDAKARKQHKREDAHRKLGLHRRPECSEIGAAVLISDVFFIENAHHRERLPLLGEFGLHILPHPRGDGQIVLGKAQPLLERRDALFARLDVFNKLFARRIRLHAVNFPRAVLFGEAASERDADEQDKEHRRQDIKALGAEIASAFKREYSAEHLIPPQTATLRGCRRSDRKVRSGIP